MADLADSILTASTGVPTPTALSVMRLSLVDWMTVGLAGMKEPVSEITRDLVLSESGAPQATLFGGARAPARAAALANGACSHALDYDDTHFAHIGHPSVAVIPAALAMAEKNGCDIDTLLQAALAGCEASVRFGLAFGREHYQVGFHQTATAGAFGATVAAVLLNTPAKGVMRQALGLVSTRASGLKNQFGTMGKPYNAGIAAANGVEAALLAAGGFVSNPGATEGAEGFLATHHGSGVSEQPDGFLMEHVSHKFHACCHGLHAALEALETLKPVDPARVEKVVIETHPRWLTVCNKNNPATGLEAKFSYRAVTAFSLLGYATASLETFSDSNCKCRKVNALMDLVEVVPKDGLSETQARVFIHDGLHVRTADHDLAGQIPLDMLSGKIRSKSRVLLGPGKANRIWEAVHDPSSGLESLIACMG